MKSRCGSPRLDTKAGAFQERYLFQIHRLAHNASPGIGVISISKKQRIALRELHSYTLEGAE